MPNGTSQYSFFGSAMVADGKLYTYNTEHTPSQPVTRGWGLYCINATSGQGIWNITGPMQPGAIADGYLTAGNSYDGYMYVFGKGQSSTTISAPQTEVVAGHNAVISRHGLGSVTRSTRHTMRLSTVNGRMDGISIHATSNTSECNRSPSVNRCS